MNHTIPHPHSATAAAAERLVAERVRRSPTSLGDLIATGRLRGIPPATTRAIIDRLAMAGALVVRPERGDIVIQRRAPK